MEDCHFFLTATCSKVSLVRMGPSRSIFKGDACPFRHSEAAKATPSVCTSWTAGGCGNTNCRYRHTSKARAPSFKPVHVASQALPCRWESTPTGCLKPGCPFAHSLTRPAPPTFQPPAYSFPFAGQNIPSFVPSCESSLRRLLL